MTSLSELADEYLDHCRVAGLSPYTIDSYRVTLMHAERYFGGDTPVADITPRHVRKFLAHRRECGDAPVTLGTRHGNLKAFWTWLVSEGEVEMNTVKAVARPRHKPEPVPLVSDDAFTKMMNVRLKSPFLAARNRAMLMVLLDCGVRVGEIIGITTEDVDWTHRMIRVSGKTGTRDVPFGSATAEHLRRYLRFRKRHHRKDDAALFIGPCGALSRDSVHHMVERHAELAGVPHVWPHALRHTFADALLSDGASVTDVQYLGGWSSPTQVLTRYGIAGTRDRALISHRRHSPGDRVARGAR